jgi:hypothetical protein
MRNSGGHQALIGRLPAALIACQSKGDTLVTRSLIIISSPHSLELSSRSHLVGPATASMSRANAANAK